MVCTPNKSSSSSDKFTRMKEKYLIKKCNLLAVNLKAMSISNDLCECKGVSRGTVSTAGDREVVRLRDTMPEKLTTFCNAHLSILLEMDDNKLDKIVRKPVTDLNANKKKATTLFSKKKERSATLAPLSKNLVFAMRKLVDYLSRPEFIETEGIFRKTGNVSRQRLVKELVLGGTGDFHLDDKTFSPHDVATVLKQILSELPNPLLTHKHYESHIKIADMSKLCLTAREKKHALEKQVKSLQLLMLMLPRENAAFLETLFKLLSRTARCPENKMAATSLGVVFAPSLICPRKLSAEGLQSVSGTLSKVVTLMIENMESIFKVPCEIAADVANFWQEMEDPSMELLTAQACNEKKAKNGSLSAMKTVNTFAERKSPEEYTFVEETQTALAQLIARVQPAKKLLKQLNRATNVQCNTKKGKHSRSRSFGESLKKHFPLLSKSMLRNLSDNDKLLLSVATLVTNDTSFANITYLNTTCNKYTPFMRNSAAVHIVDLSASLCDVEPQ